MAKYVGLTDDLARRQREHGNPIDWKQFQFTSESEARTWEQRMLATGFRGGPGGQGWHYGYTYTITAQTTQ
jgi:hypothetical protein